MPSNVTRDHHSLRRNLKLNGNYISNDGGDEGIAIADTGVVTIAPATISSYTTTEALHIVDTLNVSSGSGSTDNYYGIRYESTHVSISGYDNVYLMHLGHVSGNDFIVHRDGDLECPKVTTSMLSLTNTDEDASPVAIDIDFTSGNASPKYGLSIDYDRTGSVSTGFDTNYGIHTSLNVTGASGGTITSIGHAINVVGDTGGTSIATGLIVDVQGATTCNGIYIDNKNGGTDFKNVSSADVTDYFAISTIAAGATTLTTVDTTVGATAHLSMVADGNIILDAEGDLTLDSNSGIIEFEDNGTNLLRFGNSVGSWDVLVNTNDKDLIFKVNSNGSIVEVMRLDGSESSLHIRTVAGFTQLEEAFSGDDILAGGSGTQGTHDTQVDFRTGNKVWLQMTAAMDQMNLIFPAVSGNFLLHVWYNGDWAVGDWKVWESDLTAATNADVMWPGGTQPDNTASGKDVFSFYWDAQNQLCYGVASLAFAAP